MREGRRVGLLEGRACFSSLPLFERERFVASSGIIRRVGGAGDLVDWRTGREQGAALCCLSGIIRWRDKRDAVEKELGTDSQGLAESYLKR